jgi:hypothetical protein
VILEDELLREADREARRNRINRSQLVRTALREHLRRRRIRELEERHRRAYEESPEYPGEFDREMTGSDQSIATRMLLGALRLPASSTATASISSQPAV